MNEKSTSSMVPFHKTDHSMHVTKVYYEQEIPNGPGLSFLTVSHIIVRTITDPEQIYMYFDAYL